MLKAGERLLRNLAKQEYKIGALKTVIVVSVILSVISGIIFAVMLIKMNVEGVDSLKYVIYLIVMDLIFSFLLYFFLYSNSNIIYTDFISTKFIDQNNMLCIINNCFLMFFRIVSKYLCRKYS